MAAPSSQSFSVASDHTPPPCIVFDVDGTLTATTGVDDECLVAAWRGVWPDLGEVSTDWAAYEHSTDDGLTLEVCRGATGRDPTRGEVEGVRERFFALLRERIGRERSRCVAVPGVNGLLADLKGRGWPVGIASGAWEESARMKLEFAGVDVRGLPGTFSHPGPTGPARREEIIAGTMAKLGCTGEAMRGRGVYLGDGVWDARAARMLAIGFVGIRHDGEMERMAREGVRDVVTEYRDVAAVVKVIQGAAGMMRHVDRAR